MAVSINGHKEKGNRQRIPERASSRFAGSLSGSHMADTWYRGWRAYVDWKETKIYRANLAFRAV